MRKQPNKAELLESVNALSRDNTVLSQALNCVMRDEVQWLPRKANYRIGICEAAAPHGGIVIVTYAPADQRAYTCAYYFERWFDYYRDAYHVADTNKEFLAVREMGYECARIIHAAQRGEAIAA